ncbi:MAG: PaaI family thioesterase [Candidatus Krumholzibacteria bacterium]|nr:PaaI family thioesterase [Candidatus Krumholzibacteria bacterium]
MITEGVRHAATVSARNDHSRCMLCGSQNPRSLNLSFQAAGDGAVTTRFQAHADLQGYGDILHGGVIASLLDAAMTHCLFHRGVQAVTGDLHVRYLQSVPCDAAVDIKAWVLAAKPPLHRLRAELSLAGSIVAWAEAKFLQRR